MCGYTPHMEIYPHIWRVYLTYNGIPPYVGIHPYGGSIRGYTPIKKYTFPLWGVYPPHGGIPPIWGVWCIHPMWLVYPHMGGIPPYVKYTSHLWIVNNTSHSVLCIPHALAAFPSNVKVYTHKVVYPLMGGIPP